MSVGWKCIEHVSLAGSGGEVGRLSLVTEQAEYVAMRKVIMDNRREVVIATKYSVNAGCDMRDAVEER